MKQKYFNLIMIIGVLFFLLQSSSCSKDDSTSTNNNTNPNISPIGAVPKTFTQKVMIEENTGAWCGWCVLGADAIKTVEEENPGKINAVALHGDSRDPMVVPEYTEMLTFSGATGVPHYQMQRAKGGGFYGTFFTDVNNALAMVAECGLAIDAKKSSGNSVSFTVHAGFKSALIGDYRLIVYLVEDVVQNANSSYNQQNYTSGVAAYAGNYYFDLPPVITNYEHKHVARVLLSASLREGDQIPASFIKAGGEYTKTYTYTVLPGYGWNSAKLRVVAGILMYDAKCANQFMKNSQSVLLGSAKNWD